MQIVQVISTAFDSIKRRIVKVRRRGKDDIQTAKEYSPFGVDSNPPAGMRAIFAETGIKGKTALIGYLNLDKLAEVGETRFYSLKPDKTLSTFIWLKNDETMQIGGDTDFMVRFSKLKEVVDELQEDITTLKAAFSGWVVVPNDGGGALKLITTDWFGTPLVKDIDLAKIEEIKTI